MNFFVVAFGPVPGGTPCSSGPAPLSLFPISKSCVRMRKVLQKMKHDAFSSYHPLVNLVFFALTLVLSMFLRHPVCQVISLACAIAYSVYLKGSKAIGFQLYYMLPLMVMTALMNPVFNHQGDTVLFYLFGKAVTLEATAYGLCAAAILASVTTWFTCCNEVLTSDKFIFLFGRIIPSLSLLLSMTLRFVPRFKAHMQVVAVAREGTGADRVQNPRLHKLTCAISAFFATVSWALESAIETADSMKSRGYGLEGRSAFSIYHFGAKDGAALACLVLFGGIVLSGSALGGLDFTFYPALSGRLTGWIQLLLYGSFTALCLFPLLINLWEDLKWKSLTSKI